MGLTYSGALISAAAGDLSIDPATATTVGSSGPTSPQYAVVYDLISEGEIHGLVNGAASVYLNGTPLVAQSAASSVRSISAGNGSFTSGSVTVTSNDINLSGTAGRFILLERGAKTSNLFAANAGDFRVRANGFFVANMAINNAFIAAARPRLRITGLGPRGGEYVGTITQFIDANTAVVEPAISTSGTGKAGGWDHIAIVNTATSSSLTVFVAPTASGTKFQILSSAIPQTELNSTDTWNFKNTAVNFRVGTLNQTPVTYADVPTASFLTSIEQPLEWTNTFNGNQSPLSYGAVALGVPEASEVDKIKLGIEFPAGLYKNTGEKNKIKEAFVGFQVKFQYTQGGTIKTAVLYGPSSSTGIPSGKQKQSTWVDAISRYTGYYSAEVTSSFIHEIELPVEQFKPFTTFSVIVSRVNPHNSSDYESNDDTIINTTTLKYIECQVLDKFRYPHSAYAAITFPAEGFNSVPGRSYHVRGIKIKVPSNYTTREESATGVSVYSGAWDGTFVTKYTNNPAWVFYDLATNKRYGLGKYVDSSLVDKYALYRIARYCDELVPDGKGGFEPRFTCNVYIFQQEEAYKVLRDLATTFRGMMIWAQGALLAVQDSPKESIYTFTQGNVIDGLFNYEYSGRLARYNEVNITWNNPDQFYQQDVLTVTDQTDIIKQGRVVSMESVAFGCTSQGQAYRVALWNMLTSQLETEFISFGTGMNANFLLPGDVINVQDHHLNAVQASGRIRAASGNTVTLDRNVTIASSTFNDRTSFVNSLVSSGTDGFNDLVGNTGSRAASITRSSTNSASLGSYSYRANSTTGNLSIDSMDEYNANEYSLSKANTSNNVGLTTATSRAGIVLSTFSPAITSFGGNISVRTIANTTSEDYNVNRIASYRTYNSEIPLNVNVAYTSGVVKSYNIRASKDTFFGVSSPVNTNIANISISFSGSALSTQEFITLDNIVLGNTSSAIQSTAHTLHVVFDGPGCYLQQPSAVISGTTYYRGDLIPGITTSIAATNLLDDSGNVVTTVFSEHTHVQKRSIVNPEPYVGNIIELSSPYTSTPNVESIWALENSTYDNNVIPKQYRVLSIKEEQNGIYSVIASNYARQKFEELEGRVKIQDSAYSGPRPGQDIPSVTDLNANYLRLDTEEANDPVDSTVYAFISWTPPSESFTDTLSNVSTRQYRYIDSYEVQHNFYNNYGDTFVAERVAGNRNSLVLVGVTAGTYIVKVRVKNIYGQYSPWVSKEVTFLQPSTEPGYDISGILAGGSIDSAVVFESNTFSVIDSYYTFSTPAGRSYSINAATTAQTTQSFQSLRANSTYYLLWSGGNSADPWKAIQYYYDTTIVPPFGKGNTYWSEAGASSNGLFQLPGSITVVKNTKKVTGTGTFFSSNLTAGDLIKLQSSNTANSFYAIVDSITSNTELYTKEVITKAFTAQTIHTPSLRIDYVNDTIFSKIVKNTSNIAIEDIRYATTAIDEPQLLVLDADSNGFKYTSAGGLIGPSIITFSVNRQNLRGNTDWYAYDSNNNILATSILSNRTNTSAQLNATSFGSISNNNFIKVTSNVGSLSSSYTVLKIIDGANGVLGRGAHTVLLVNENHSIPVDSAGLNGIYTASGTDILVWEANTPLTYNASATLVPSFNVAIINTANITANASPITVTTAVANDTRRYGNHSNITANSAYIVYAVGVRDLLGNLTTYYKQQSFTATRNGTVGANGRGAHTVLLVNENHSIPLDASGLNGIYTASGTDILVWEANTPLTYNASATLVPSFNVAVVSTANITANASPITVTTAVTNDTRRYGNHSNINANTASIVYNIGVRDTLGNLTTYTRQQSFTGVRAGVTGISGANGANGRGAHTVLLVNENHSIPLDPNGLNGIYTASGTDILVWEGNTPLTYNASGTLFPSFNVAVTSNTNINVNTSPSTVTTVATNDTRRYGNHSNITSNSASIIYNIGVRDTLGNFTNYTRQQTFTGVRAGIPAKYFKVISTEYDYTTDNTIAGIYINGVEVTGALGRGHTLLVYNPATDQIVTGPTTYDTYGVGTSGLVTAINSVATGNIVLLASSDATTCDAALRTALQSCGARLTSTWSLSRIAHAFIGQKGKELGTAYESTGSGTGADSTQTQVAYFTESGIALNGTIGRSAHTVLLVNENHSIPLDSSGLNGIYTASGTDILVWEGNTPLTYNASVTISPSFNVAVVSNTNINVNTSPSTVTTVITNDTRRYGNHSNLIANTGSIVYNITVKDTLGNLTTYTRQQSFTGVRSGATGAPGANGANGANGEPAISLSLSRAGITLFAYAEGTVASYSGASGQASLYRGDTNITESASWTSAQTVGLTGTVSNTGGSRGQYSVTNLATANDTGTLTINASYAGKTYTGEFSVAKAKGGYEIVNTLPSTNLFEGRVVFLTGEDILYRYTGTAWTAAVPAANITGQLLEAQLAINSVNTAQLVGSAVTQVKMAINSVNTAQLVSNAVTEVKMALNSVNTSAIVSSAITEVKMALNSVNTSAIVSSAITQVKMAANSVNTAQLVGNAITEAKMALNSVNTSAIVSNAITEVKMGLNSVNTAALVANAITQVKIATNAVGAAQVQVGAITAPKLNITLGGGNLLNNSGFESAVDLENWTNNLTFTRSSSTDRSLSGTKSAKFVHTTSGQDTYLYQQFTNPQPNTTYTFTAWVYVESITGGALGNRDILVFDGVVSTATATLSTSHPTGVWTKKSLTLTTSATPSYFEVRLYAANGTVYWDNCQLELGDVSTAYAPRTDEILPGTITSTEIANNAITTPKLVAEAVVAGKIAANAVTANTIAANAITTEKLEANSIVAEKLAANSIVTRHLSANSVTTEALAANSVVAENISANSVVASKIAANSITAIQLAANAVLAENISANSIIAGKIAANAVSAIQLIANSVIAGKIAANAIFAENMTANSVTALQLAANAVLAENIAANSVVASKIAANSITTIQLAANAVLAENISANAVTAGAIAANSITTTQLAANAVLAENISANAVTAGAIAANSITTLQLAANAVFAYNISANAVTANAIAANSINALQLAANAVYAYHVSANAVTAEAIAANAVTAVQIAANSITTNKINVGAITAATISTANAVITNTIQIANGIINNAKIIDLSADKLNAGSINVATVSIRGTSTTGLSINSASSGERLEMSTTTIRIFDSSGNLRVKIGNLA